MKTILIEKYHPERNPIEYDAQKCLEFWQWWLQEAVPQACEVDI